MTEFVPSVGLHYCVVVCFRQLPATKFYFQRRWKPMEQMPASDKSRLSSWKCFAFVKKRISEASERVFRESYTFGTFVAFQGETKWWFAGKHPWAEPAVFTCSCLERLFGETVKCSSLAETNEPEGGREREGETSGCDVWGHWSNDFMCDRAKSSIAGGSLHSLVKPRLKAFVIFWSSLISAQQMSDLSSKWLPHTHNTTIMIDSDTRLRGLSRALIKKGLEMKCNVQMSNELVFFFF